MHKLLASLRKEILILLRDVPGLVILFLLPVVLIMVVTMAQNFALSNQITRTKVLIVNLSGSESAQQVIHDLEEARLFEPVHEYRGIPVGRSMASSLISTGEFQFGVIFYPQDSAIHILVDPTLGESFKSNLSNAIIYVIRGSQSRAAIGNMLSAIPPAMKPVIDDMIRDALGNLPPVRESYALKENASIKPNVIQNNVPGFILFAMFFVVLPLSGSLINERKDVAFQRLKTLPVGISTLIASKVIIYTAVCLIQFLLMLAVGRWIFPLVLNLPPIETGTQFFALAIATLAASLAAVGFGVLVGTAATSHNQAALFGAVMVVVLGVISGTFLPVHVMPETLQWVSRFSPVRWGIENYLDLFIREGSLITILPNSFLLLLFFGLAMTISIVIFARKN